jgi:hypothetical protein
VKRKRESSNEEMEAKKKNRKSQKLEKKYKSRENKVISVESDNGSDYSSNE